MSLPPGFLDELRSRTSLTHVVGRKVMWDQRKSNQAKGDMWAPCPFHQEKTASFHVDDRKGYYYCFGCHAKGDAISFVRETENVDFMEAVRILADEAGMPMPARDPQAQQKADRRTELANVMEQAVQFFRLQLKTGGGVAARDYLDGRGLSEAARDRWEIGFAPDAWQGLWDHLTGKGIAEDLILGCGLAKPSNKGKRPYDTFRNRIIFPIRDARGHCIAFGGRAMDPNDNAKYLNSPETELFDKGRSLYNHGPAREAAGKGQPLIVAEGYMDVIALAEAGFGASVAPLGTAVTESQLELLWRISPEPIIALDGDTAGLRAAMRVVDLALPLLEAGKSLRFALMPEGKDPDDLIRAKGAAAVQAVLDQAKPMVDLLWQREIEGKVFDSPERKAALDKALRDKLKLIRDPSIRKHYGEAVKQLRWEVFRPSNWTDRYRPRSKSLRQGARPETIRSMIASDRSNRVGERLREMVILALLMTHPNIISQFEADLETFDLLEDGHQEFLFVLLANYETEADEVLLGKIIEIVGAHRVESILKSPHVTVIPAVRERDDTEKAIFTLAEQLAKLSAERSLRIEIEEAEEDIVGFTDEHLTWRLSHAAEERNKAEKGVQEDSAEYEYGPNGAPIARHERDEFDAVYERIDFTKGGRGRRS